MDDISNIDVRKLEKCYLDAMADLRAFQQISEHLRVENDHLRNLIALLIQSK